MNPYSEIREKPWGHEVVFTPSDLARAGKVLFVKAGHKLSLQYHDLKEETIMLFQGQANIWLGATVDNVEIKPMELQAGYTIVPGVVHRLEAITDSYFFEVSSKEAGTTFRLQDDYARPPEEVR